jgi:hypothetical protein
MVVSVSSRRPSVRIGLHLFDRLAQIKRQELEEVWKGMIKHDISHDRRHNRPQNHIDVGTHHSLDHLAGRGWHGHEQIVGGRAPGLEHLDDADRCGQVVIFRSAVAV